jgi:hypothetical protein
MTRPNLQLSLSGLANIKAKYGITGEVSNIRPRHGHGEDYGTDRAKGFVHPAY